jgi:hypothetical protein
MIRLPGATLIVAYDGRVLLERGARDPSRRF